MKEWVVLNEEWMLRPTIDAFEFMGLECNIRLEWEAPQKKEEFAAILSGARPISGGTKGATIRRVLRDLEKQRIIQLVNQTPAKGVELSEIGKKLWKIREHLVGSDGPISVVYRLDPKKSAFSPSQLYFFTAKYVQITERGKEKVEDWSYGIHENLEVAEFKAIVEGLERYASGILPVEEFIKSSAAKLGKVALDPRRVIAYSEDQYSFEFPLVPFSEEREYYWKEVIILPEGTKRYLPIECLYYPVEVSFAPNRYTFANSSGVAAGLSFEDALLRALYESIERDSFMIGWCNRLIMPTVQKGFLATEQQQIAEIEAIGYQVYLINLTLDLAPVALVAAVSYEREPALVLGAASNLVVEKAITKALREVQQQLYWDSREDNVISVLLKPEEVKDVAEHMALYAGQKHLSKASFLWKGKPQPVSRGHFEEEDELTELLNILGSQRKEVVVADLTPANLKRVGVWVVRAIPLGLVPISFGYGMEPLGMRRLREIPFQMGFRENPWENNKPFTHPFG